jgi:hypothetical protein
MRLATELIFTPTGRGILNTFGLLGDDAPLAVPVLATDTVGQVAELIGVSHDSHTLLVIDNTGTRRYMRLDISATQSKPESPVADNMPVRHNAEIGMLVDALIAHGEHQHEVFVEVLGGIAHTTGDQYASA